MVLCCVYPENTYMYTRSWIRSTEHSACALRAVWLQVSSATRIEVVTEGILLRRLQQDPSLEVSNSAVRDDNE